LYAVIDGVALPLLLGGIRCDGAADDERTDAEADPEADIAAAAPIASAAPTATAASGLKRVLASPPRRGDAPAGLEPGKGRST
jgi:hypothetical protein